MVIRWKCKRIDGFQGHPPFKILSPRKLPDNATVANVFLPNKEWNIRILTNNCLSMDVETILKIPKGNVYSRDELVWHFDKSGEYFVAMGIRYWWIAILKLNWLREYLFEIGGRLCGKRVFQVRIRFLIGELVLLLCRPMEVCFLGECALKVGAIDAEFMSHAILWCSHATEI